jgi:hypothetical protein
MLEGVITSQRFKRVTRRPNRVASDHRTGASMMPQPYLAPLAPLHGQKVVFRDRIGLRVAVEMRRAPFACAIGSVSVADGHHRRICSRNKVSDRLLSCAIGWACSDPPQWLTLTLEVLANISNITVRGTQPAPSRLHLAQPACPDASLHPSTLGN